MPANNYPEGLDELAILASQDFPEVKHCYLKDLVGFSRALLDALAERGIVWVGAKKQAQPVAYLHRLEKRVELSFFDDSANVSSRKDWIGSIPLYEHPDIPGRVALPDGWKMVPLEPTGDMLGVLTNTAAMCNSWKEGYRAMLSAAPTPPTPPQGDELFGTCGCGRAVRYMVMRDGQEVGSCNKHVRCLTREELEAALIDTTRRLYAMEASNGNA